MITSWVAIFLIELDGGGGGGGFIHSNLCDCKLWPSNSVFLDLDRNAFLH
jgi:hypothetical protein